MCLDLVATLHSHLPGRVKEPFLNVFNVNDQVRPSEQGELFTAIPDFLQHQLTLKKCSY